MVNLLGAQLFALAFAGFIIFYIALERYLLFRKGKRFDDHAAASAVPLAAIGIYMFVSGMFGQAVGPLPGTYNILFYDIYPLVGLLFVSIAIVVWKGLQLRYIGFWAFLTGIMSIAYGINGYIMGMTSSPLALIGIYLPFGAAGILGWPLAVMMDRSGKRAGALAVLVFILFCIAILIGSFVTIYIGFSAIPAHLAGA